MENKPNTLAIFLNGTLHARYWMVTDIGDDPLIDTVPNEIGGVMRGLLEMSDNQEITIRKYYDERIKDGRVE